MWYKDLGKAALLLFLTLVMLAAGADAFAGSLPRVYAPVTPSLRIGAFDIGHRGLVARTVTGVSLPLNLSAANRDLGTARFIGGIETSAADGAAVGGVLWQAGGPDGLGAGLGVLRTGLPSGAGGGLFKRANLRLPLPFLDSDPSLGLALGSFAGDAGTDAGEAGRLSFAIDALGGRYSLSYAQAQSGFRPLGSQLAAAQTNLDLSGRYTFGPYQLTQAFEFQPLRPNDTGESRGWRSDTFWGGPVVAWFPLFTTFQLHASLRRFRPTIDDQASHTGWVFAAQGKGVYWRAWQFDASVALGHKVACAPTNHAAWLLGGARPIRLGGFTGSLDTHLGVKLRTNTQTRWRLSSSVAVTMHDSAQQLSLGVHWLPDDWDKSTDDKSSWRVMFRYSIAAAKTLPRLVSALGQMVPGM